MAEITAEQVWDELEKNLFAVLGMVTADNEARTSGVVYVVNNHKLYIGSDKKAWKVKHLAQNPSVSVTVPIAKRIPFMPWVKIPAATITFSGKAAILTLDDIDAKTRQALFRGLENKDDVRETSRIIEVTPESDCITYGVGVSLMGMRDTANARGRVRITE
ncbi:MAG: pyridoxamine 5'-phosphate oxidase family protein [Caldilineales bacterium]|nr:pyridoxamine 5'-phosphate oxidase family protein [Caldilineales bacterium]